MIPLPKADRWRAYTPVAVHVFVAGVALAGCPRVGEREDGLDPSTLPENVRADYALFAQRCSKCHSLARPLDSGITDDGYWEIYVARMRNQPASGISLNDVPPILRFLHYYSIEDRPTKKAKADSGLPSSSDQATGEPPDAQADGANETSPPGGPARTPENPP